MQEWVEYLTSDADSPVANLRRKNGRAEPWKIRYFGIGNENWGCGGNMRPEYYADLFLRYNTYVRNLSGNQVYRIAGGAPGADYAWTEAVMGIAGRFMDGLSLHYYTIPSGVWAKKGAATGFTEERWHSTLGQTLQMDELLARHGAIMDRHDPAKRIGLIVDEWGTWYEVEPGSNPGFLYQQNTLRDALVAALNFHVFHRHAAPGGDGQHFLAQTVNVLQAMILTAGERMILTPTYHVFELYQVHQGAVVLPVEVRAPAYARGGQVDPLGQRHGLARILGPRASVHREHRSAPRRRRHLRPLRPVRQPRAGPHPDRRRGRRAQHLRAARRRPAPGVHGLPLRR